MKHEHIKDFNYKGGSKKINDFIANLKASTIEFSKKDDNFLSNMTILVNLMNQVSTDQGEGFIDTISSISNYGFYDVSIFVIGFGVVAIIALSYAIVGFYYEEDILWVLVCALIFIFIFIILLRLFFFKTINDLIDKHARNLKIQFEDKVLEKLIDEKLLSFVNKSYNIQMYNSYFFLYKFIRMYQILKDKNNSCINGNKKKEQTHDSSKFESDSPIKSNGNMEKGTHIKPRNSRIFLQDNIFDEEELYRKNLYKINPNQEYDIRTGKPVYPSFVMSD